MERIGGGGGGLSRGPSSNEEIAGKGGSGTTTTLSGRRVSVRSCGEVGGIGGEVSSGEIGGGGVRGEFRLPNSRWSTGGPQTWTSCADS